MLVSVIIPAFNSAAFLPVLFKELSRQTYTRFEVIVVDDGSTDETEECCHRATIDDPRIKYFRKANRGASCARNFGLSKAKGSFVTFIDSDDEVDSDFLETLIEEEKASDADIVVMPMDAMHLKENKMKLLNSERILGKPNIIKAFFDGKMGIGPCSKLYKAQLLDGLTFNEELVINEDKLFLFSYLCRCGSASILPNRKYHYIKRLDSTTSRTDFLKKAQDIFAVYQAINRQAIIVDQGSLKQHNLVTLLYIYKLLVRSMSKDDLVKTVCHEVSRQWHTKGRLNAKTRTESFLFLFAKPIYRLILKVYYKRAARRQ